MEALPSKPVARFTDVVEKEYASLEGNKKRITAFSAKEWPKGEAKTKNKTGRSARDGPFAAELEVKTNSNILTHRQPESRLRWSWISGADLPVQVLCSF